MMIGVSRVGMRAFRPVGLVRGQRVDSVALMKIDECLTRGARFLERRKA